MDIEEEKTNIDSAEVVQDIANSPIVENEVKDKITAGLTISENNSEEMAQPKNDTSINEMIQSQLKSAMEEIKKQHAEELNRVKEELKKQISPVDTESIKEEIVKAQNEMRQDQEIAIFKEANKNLRSTIISQIVQGNKKGVTDSEVANIAKMEAWNAVRNFTMDKDRPKVVNEIAMQLQAPFKEMLSNMIVLVNKQVAAEQNVPNVQKTDNVVEKNNHSSGNSLADQWAKGFR